MNYLTSLSGSVKCMYSNELADYTYKNFNVYIKILISLAVYKFPSGSANYSHFSAEIPCEM